MREADHFVASVGGSPTNLAIVATRLGIPSAVLSATGDDYAADLVLAQLANFGVDTTFIRRDPRGATSMALLATVSADEGERQFYRQNPADALLEPAVAGELPWESLDTVAVSADSLANGSTPQAVRRITETARDLSLNVWWDLDLRESTWSADRPYSSIVPTFVKSSDFVIGTEDEFAAYFGHATTDAPLVDAAIRGSGLRRVVLKRGAHGVSLYLDGQREFDMPAQSALPVCTVGGGDTTAGALIAARCAGWSWRDALELAMTAAAWTVEQPYCSTGFPSATDLDLKPLEFGERMEAER